MWEKRENLAWRDVTWKSLICVQHYVTPWTIQFMHPPGQNTGVGSLSLSRGSSQPRDRTQVYRIAGGFFTRWDTSINIAERDMRLKNK